MQESNTLAYYFIEQSMARKGLWHRGTGQEGDSEHFGNGNQVSISSTLCARNLQRNKPVIFENIAREHAIMA